VFPKDALGSLKDLRKGLELNRNRDVDWLRALDKPSSQRLIGVWAQLDLTDSSLQLTLTDEDGHHATVLQPWPSAQRQRARDASAAQTQLGNQLNRLGNTIFIASGSDWIKADGAFDHLFVPSSLLNGLRRDAVAALEAARASAFTRLPRAQPVDPPVPYPDTSLSYLANVFNQAARAFYARHGVQVIAPAYEAIEEPGEVSLMITKHCVRFSLSLCPKQAKGVIGVQGQVRAEPLQLVNGKEKLTLRFDCKPCEMHVLGKMKPAVAKQCRQQLVTPPPPGVPFTLVKTRPA